MNRIATIMVFTTLVALSSQVIADDSMTAQQKQQMKDCMTRQKARHDQNMSQAAMETLCKEKINMKKEGNDLTTGAPVEAPHN